MALEAIATISLVGRWVRIQALATVRADQVGARRPVVVAPVDLLGAFVNVGAVLTLKVDLRQFASRRCESEAGQACAIEGALGVQALRVWRTVIWSRGRQRCCQGALVHVRAVNAVAPVPGHGARAVVRASLCRRVILACSIGAVG